ncbi:mCG1033049, partial [Mus musculus]
GWVKGSGIRAEATQLDHLLSCCSAHPQESLTPECLEWLPCRAYQAAFWVYFHLTIASLFSRSCWEMFNLRIRTLATELSLHVTFRNYESQTSGRRRLFIIY